MAGEAIERVLSDLRCAMESSFSAGSCSSAGERPFVTLSYAQSIDGSISLAADRSTRLSGDASMALTHRLRAAHDAILVGVNTVVSDNPSLTVRLCAGSSPQPVVLDSNLHIPSSCALLSSERCRRPIVMAAERAAESDARRVSSSGATVLRCRADAQRRVDLPHAMHLLAQQPHIRSMMVEGGAAIIRSFLEHRMVDYVIVTVAPLFLGGVRAVDAAGGVVQRRDGRGGDGEDDFPRLRAVRYERLENDLIISGELASALPTSSTLQRVARANKAVPSDAPKSP